MARDTRSVTRTVTVDAPASEVWRLVGDFHRLDAWHPGVAKSERFAESNADANSDASAGRSAQLSAGRDFPDERPGREPGP